MRYVGTSGSNEGQSVAVSNQISTNQNNQSNSSDNQNREAAAANESSLFLEYPQGTSQLPSSVLPARKDSCFLRKTYNVI